MNIKKAIKAFEKRKSVYYNDPDGLASGNYIITAMNDEHEKAIIKKGNVLIQVDIADLS